MEIITPNYEEMSKTSAKIIASEIRRKHDLVLGMATGDTPVGMYQELVGFTKKRVSISQNQVIQS